jgi:hypothetical protein
MMECVSDADPVVRVDDKHFGDQVASGLS